MGGIEATAVVLAGGGSTRMGFNKALLRLGEDTIIERTVMPLKDIFEEVIIITDTPEQYSFINGVAFYPDALRIKEKNSMIGIYSGLLRARYSKAFVVACDMPFLNRQLLNYMKQQLADEDILIPKVGGHYEPLHAFYSKNCLELFEERIRVGKYKVTGTFDSFKIKLVEEDTIRAFDDELLSFININTYEEFLKTRRLIEE